MDYKYPNPRVPPAINSVEQQTYVNSLIAQHNSRQSQSQPSGQQVNTPSAQTSAQSTIQTSVQPPVQAVSNSLNENSVDPLANLSTTSSPNNNIQPPNHNPVPNFNTNNHHLSLFNPASIDPFDFTSYPLTNPPIFDSSMMLNVTNDGVLRRRRISISNGQIGQLVNHHDDFLDDDIMGQYSPLQQTGSIGNNINSVNIPSVHNGNQLNQSATINSMGLNGNNNDDIDGISKSTLDESNLNNGIPTHQLIYNNEIIFNPNGGPIPGTAAWKRERLLERNRIAASKCRQRKKQAQQQLQKNSEKYQLENKKLVKKIESLSEIILKFRVAIQNHIADCNNDSSPSLQILSDLLKIDENESCVDKARNLKSKANATAKVEPSAGYEDFEEPSLQ